MHFFYKEDFITKSAKLHTQKGKIHIYIYIDREEKINICVSAQRKGPSVGIFISKKIRF